MKITLCGKGGSGKSTIASMLAREYVKEGKSVLVIDTDESNYGLHRQLGLDLPQDLTNYFGGKKAFMQKLRESENKELFDKKWGLEDIPKDFVSEKGGIKLVAVGKIHEAGEGCACPMGILSRCFIGNLKLGPDDVVITDTEAGIEHFGRNVEKDVDVIVMVVDPSYESLKLSAKVSELCASMDKPFYYILNKVSAENESDMRQAIGDAGRIVAAIPSDSKVASAGLKGDELTAEFSGIKELAGFLMKNVKCS